MVSAHPVVQLLTGIVLVGRPSAAPCYGFVNLFINNSSPGAWGLGLGRWALGHMQIELRAE